jgi:hypothetical protein
MGGKTEVRIVTIFVHFLNCYLRVFEITASVVCIQFVSCDGLILDVLNRNVNLYFSSQSK